MAQTIPVKITNMSSLVGSLGSGLTMVCIIGYFAVIAPATEAGERERAAHAAICDYKAGLHAQLTGTGYQDDDYYDDDDTDTGDIAGMIAVPNGAVVEWVLGPRPLWWEIGSLDDWGNVPPKELKDKIHEALEVLSAGSPEKK